MRLEGNAAIITGAAQGIGRAIALEFASDRLKDNDEIVLAAYKQNSSSVKFASGRMKEYVKSLNK